jgi:hypothetical protein
MNSINKNNKNFKTKLLFGNLSNSERDLYDKISRLVDIPDVMRILDSSEFFRKEYLKQEFNKSSRFKIDKIHHTGVPLKESREKKLRNEKINSVSFQNFTKPPFNKTRLELNRFTDQTRKLRYFTMGSLSGGVQKKQFERWSPEEMYNWWLKLRISGIPKSEWKIMDVVFFLFINQISCICNSYIKYGINNNSSNKRVFGKELRLLSKYFNLLDEFYKSGGEYGLLIVTHIAFCEWFQHRIRYNNKFKIYVEYERNKNTNNFNIARLYNKRISNTIILKKNINESNNSISNNLKKFYEIYQKFNDDNNFTLILFTSYTQNPTNFINLYSIPIITCLGVPNKTHNGDYYSPFSQIDHDILFHSRKLRNYLLNLYEGQNRNNMEIDIKSFKKKMIFLQILYTKKESDAQILFWILINEYFFDITKIFFNNKYISLGNLVSIRRDNRNNIFYKHRISVINNILRKYYSNANNPLQYLKIDDSNISKFFDIEFLLQQLQILQYLLNELISKEEKKVLPRLCNSINVLIETLQIVSSKHNN